MGSGSISRLVAGPFRGIAGSLLAGLGAVLGAGLPPVSHAGGVEGRPDHLVPNAREVPDPTTSDQHDGVLLKVVADARDVGGDLDAGGQANSSDLPWRGVRLLGGGGVDARAHAAALRRAP